MTVSRGDAVPDLEHAIDPAAPLRLLLSRTNPPSCSSWPTSCARPAMPSTRRPMAARRSTSCRPALFAAADRLGHAAHGRVELCRALRAAQLPNYVYTLLLTGRDGLDHVVAGLDAGADDYLVKPVEDIELKARLATGRRIVMLEQSLRAANEENRRLSVMDPLTGACNRRY